MIINVCGNQQEAKLKSNQKKLLNAHKLNRIVKKYSLRSPIESRSRVCERKRQFLWYMCPTYYKYKFTPSTARGDFFIRQASTC